MAVWWKALPLTANCLSPLSAFESFPGHVRKLPVTWGCAVVFAGCSGFPHQLQLASHDRSAVWQKRWRKTKFQIPIVSWTLTLPMLRTHSFKGQGYKVL